MNVHGKIFAFLFLGFILSTASYGAFQRDYVKETQTDPVAVTEELLTRESEAGPASPSFKMTDTSLFFVKEPFDDETLEFLDVNLDPEPEVSAENWDDWFRTSEEDVESTEPLA